MEPIELPLRQRQLQLGTISAQVVERKALLARALCEERSNNFWVGCPCVPRNGVCARQRGIVLNPVMPAKLLERYRITVPAQQHRFGTKESSERRAKVEDLPTLLDKLEKAQVLSIARSTMRRVRMSRNRLSRDVQVTVVGHG